MLKFLNLNPSRESRAIQIWQTLVGKAHNRQTITYDQLRKLLGYPSDGARVMGQFLDPIKCFCIQNGLPPLTILVVNDTTGSPGVGFNPWCRKQRTGEGIQTRLV